MRPTCADLVRVSTLLLASVATWPGSGQPSAAVAGDDRASIAGPAQVTDEDAMAYGRLRQMMKEGRFAEAEQGARDRLMVLDDAGRSETLHAASVIELLLYSLLSQSDMAKLQSPETLDLARRQVELRELPPDVPASETAHSLTTLARIHLARGEMDEAMDIAGRSLNTLEASYGPAAAEVADTAKFIGQIHLRRGDFATAKYWLERAMRIIEQSAGPRSVPMADILQILGKTCGELRETEQASAYLQQSAEIFAATNGPRHDSVGRSLTYLAQVQWRAGQPEAARRNLETALEILESVHGPDSPILFVPLNALGLVLSDLGEYGQAAKAFERSLQRNPDDAATVNNYGILRDRMGDGDEAIRLFDRAAALWGGDAALGPPDRAFALENKGIVLAGRGDLAGARPLFERALEIRRNAFGTDHLFVAESLDNLTGLEIQAGNVDAAEELSRLAMGIRERALPPDSLLLAPTLVNLSHVAHLRDQIPMALAHASRALAIQQASLGDAHPDVAETRLWIAFLLALSGEFERSVVNALVADESGREHLLLAAQAFGERELLKYAVERPSGIDLLMTLAIERPDCCPHLADRVFDSVVKDRALVLDQTAATRRAAAGSTDARGRMLETRLSETSRRLAGLVVRGPAEGETTRYLESLERARNDRQAAEQELTAYAAATGQYAGNQSVDAQQVAAAVPPEAAIVAYRRYAPKALSRGGGARPDSGAPAYAAFVIAGPGATATVVDLGPAEPIDRLIAAVRQNVIQEAQAAGRASSGERRYRSIAGQLRQLIWDPVQRHLADARIVLIVPDGAIHLVDHAALPVDSGGYLVEAGPRFHRLSAERDIVVDALHDDRGTMLALGGPAFDRVGPSAARSPPRPAAVGAAQVAAASYRGPRAACGDFRHMLFDPLPGATREIRDVVRIWGDAQDPNGLKRPAETLVGDQAGETEFRLQASGKRILHLATHGFFLGGDCGSALDAGAATAGLTRENPLLLSGLAFAGANSRDRAGPEEDDGILTAEEISTLDLRATEWAVLSACDTGSGEVRVGEGVLGLQRAFRIAGVQTIIMSLWPVEDQATRRWMTALYRHHLVDGQSTAESVRSAHLDLLAERRAKGLSAHPFYWAGFVASGAWH